MAKVMLVEDDNNLREIYEARLQAEGYTIVSAKDGEEALVVAKAEQPDLIISDVMMPKISGFEMLDILRNTEGMQGVKVIMLTALGQSDDQQRADRLGADRYLVKSQVTLEDIVKVTHELLNDTGTPAADASSAAPSPDAAAPAAPSPAPAPGSEPGSEPTSEPTPSPQTPSDPVAAAVTTPPVMSIPVTDAPAPAQDTAAKPEPTTTTAQEEAQVEAQIEDFVAGASSDATAPAPATDAAAPTPAEPSVPATASDPVPAASAQPVEFVATSPPPTPAPASDPSTASLNDDKLLNEAVTALNIESSEAPAAASPSSEATAPAAVPPAPAQDTPAVDDNPANNHVEIAHKKIISPLDSAPKKDIDALLAIEESKEPAAKVEEAKASGNSAQDKTPESDDEPQNPADVGSVAL